MSAVTWSDECLVTRALETGGFVMPCVRARRAHAMKNCLSVVGAVIHLVQRDLEGKSLERLQRAREALRRLEQHVGEDLDPCSTVPRSVMTLADVCSKVHERVEEVAVEREVDLVVDCALDAGSIHGHIDDLVDALENLVLNAVRASGPGSLVTLGATGAGDGRARLTVRDRGRGMTPDELARYGEPFVSTFAGGSGIGVVTARHVVERHDGTIEVASTRDAGTIVTILLNATPP